MTCTSFTVWCSLSGVFVSFTGKALNVRCSSHCSTAPSCLTLYEGEKEQKDDPILANQIIGDHMANTLAWLQFVSLSLLPLSRLVSSHLVFPPHELFRSLIFTRLFFSSRISPSRLSFSNTLILSPLRFSLLFSSYFLSSHLLSFRLILFLLLLSSLFFSPFILSCFLSTSFVSSRLILK